MHLSETVIFTTKPPERVAVTPEGVVLLHYDRSVGMAFSIDELEEHIDNLIEAGMQARRIMAERHAGAVA